MRVLIVYPPITKAERYGSSIGASGGSQIPLGVFYLASYLRRGGHAVGVVDGEAEDLTEDECLARAREFRPGLVGVSSTTVAFHRAVAFAVILRENMPETPLVIGGPHVSSNPRHALGCGLFLAGVVGEGEEAFLELVEALEAGREWRAIRNLAYVGGTGGLALNPRRPPVRDLDSLPFPAYDLIPDMDRYAPPPHNYRARPVANVITSRGCPNSCTFCDQNVFGRELRQRGPDGIAEEILLLHGRHGIREIAFVDDTFTINPVRIRGIFDRLASRNVRLPWTCMSRVNTIGREDVLYMKQAGCWRISFGIESGDEEILRRIRKNITLDRVRETLGWCREAGIETSGFFMIGHPGETAESIDKTVAFALSLPLTSMVTTINTPIPGSEQYASIRSFGSLDDTDWSKFNYWRPVFVPRGLSEAALLDRQKSFYRRFYLRPRVVLSFARNFFRPGGLGRFASLLKSLPFLFARGWK